MTQCSRAAYVRRQPMRLSSLAAITSVLVFIPSVHATIVSSWESDYDGWVVSGFNAAPVELDLSPNGATDGSSALSVSQMGQGFSWNIRRDNVGSDNFYNLLNSAVLDNPANYTVELDITYVNSFIPDGVTFLNASIAFNSDAGYHAVHSLAGTNGAEDTTIHLSLPFDSWQVAANSSFYQMVIAINGDWGASPSTATVFYDSLRLVNNVPEPTGAALMLLGLAAVTHRRKRRNG
jgi:hypothetical protein